MSKSSGSLLVEVMLSMLIFTIGILALTLAFTFSVRVILDSGKATVREQKLAGDVESYLLARTMKHDDAPSPSGEGVTELPGGNFVINGKNLPFRLFRYSAAGKKTAAMYVIEKAGQP